MKTQSRIAEIQNEMTGGKSFGFDTSFLLFFLAVEFGRTVFSLSFDNAFLFLTLLMVAVLPYVFSSFRRKADVRKLAARQKFDCRFGDSARRDVQTIFGCGSAGNISVSADDTAHCDGDAQLLRSILRFFQTSSCKIGKRRKRSVQ